RSYLGPPRPVCFLLDAARPFESEPNVLRAQDSEHALLSVRGRGHWSGGLVRLGSLSSAGRHAGPAVSLGAAALVASRAAAPGVQPTGGSANDIAGVSDFCELLYDTVEIASFAFGSRGIFGNARGAFVFVGILGDFGRRPCDGLLSQVPSAGVECGA